MAAPSKEYAYFVKGNKISLVEKDSSAYSGAEILNDDGSGTGTYQRAHGESNRTDYKSPLAAVTNGLKIEYSYAPSYIINNTSDTKSITAYTSASGLLSLTTNPSMSATAGDWILITGSNRWDGLHQVNATISSQTTLVLKTRYNAGSISEDFTITLGVTVMEDEDFELDVPEYLEEAIIYYMKARLAEDAMQVDQREYFMNLFRKRIERHESSRKWGARMISSGPFAIK